MNSLYVYLSQQGKHSLTKRKSHLFFVKAPRSSIYSLAFSHIVHTRYEKQRFMSR